MFFSHLTSNLIHTGAFIALNDEGRVFIFYFKLTILYGTTKQVHMYGTTFSMVMFSQKDLEGFPLKNDIFKMF